MAIWLTKNWLGWSDKTFIGGAPPIGLEHSIEAGTALLVAYFKLKRTFRRIEGDAAAIVAEIDHIRSLGIEALRKRWRLMVQCDPAQRPDQGHHRPDDR